MTIIQKPTPHHSSRDGHKPTLIVIHGDAGKTDQGTISWLAAAESKVSYHYLVGRDGKLYGFVPETQNAWHAGVSKYKGEEIGNSVNRISIGVAFANNGLGHEAYNAVQYEKGGELVAEICKRHGIPLHRVVSHADVSPGRKTDPWSWFDWEAFRCEFGKHTAA